MTPDQAVTAPVAIIGGGPVGLMLAMNLDFFGVRSVLINTDATTRWLPKGSTHNARTLEHFRRLGISKQVRALGLPADYPTDVGYFTRFNGRQLARLKMPSEAEKQRTVARASATDQVPEPILRCNQMYVERFAFEHVKTLPSVSLRFGWNCVDWSDRGDHVTVEIEEVAPEEGATKRRETWRCAYLVGCDGAHGIVREKLSARYDGVTLKQDYLGGPMLNSHVSAPDFYRVVKAPLCWQYWAVNPEMRGNLVVLDGKGEFILTSRLNALDDQVPEADIARRLCAMAGVDMPVKFIGHSAWTAGHVRVADYFARGRAFMAGDAVHLFTPAGGFGMNTGVDDAVNLAWKLAAVVQGWGGPNLLATYEIERKPVARRNTAAMGQLTRNIGAVPIGQDMEKDTAAGAGQRRTAGDYLSGFGEEFASLGVQLGARYDGSPIVVSDGTAPPPHDPFRYVASACPGGRTPHLWLDGHVSLFDRLGRYFTVLRFNPEREVGALRAAAQTRGVPLTVLDVDLPEGRDLYQRDLALIRPDQHVAWRGDTVPDDCGALIDTVTASA